VIPAQPRGRRSGWSRCFNAASPLRGRWLLLPLAQNLLVEKRIFEQGTAALRQTDRTMPASASMWQRDRCSICVNPGTGRAPRPKRRSETQPPIDPLDELILALFDIGRLLFGDYVQPPVAIFNYYIDLGQSIVRSDCFHRVLHAYARPGFEPMTFDRIAGIP